MKPDATDLASFAEAAAAERLKTLEANLRHAKEHPDHDDPVHDMRVSIRRFTQALRVFKDQWDQGHYRKMRKSLRKWMDLCGDVRNCDIAFEALKAAGAPATGSLETFLRKRRSHAESELAKRLKQSGTDWQSWLHAHSRKKRSIQARARQILRPLERKYLKAGTNAARPGTNPDRLHELRLEAKRLRYSLEIFGSLSGADWEHQVERIKNVQDFLGAVNDCVTTRVLIEEYGHNAKARPWQTALKSLLDKRVEEFRAHWRKPGDEKRPLAPQKRRTD